MDEWDVVLHTHHIVIFTISWCSMHYTGTVRQSNKVSMDHEERSLFRGMEWHQLLVVCAYKLFAQELTDDFILSSVQNLSAKLLGKDENLLSHFRFHIGKALIYSQCCIGWQCPWGCGPGENVLILCALHLELGNGGGVFDILIPLRNFMGRKPCSTSWTVGHNFEALIEKILLPHGLQRPPFRFDIVIFIGDVRVFHIYPETDLLRHFFPHAGVLEYTFLTFIDEVFYPILFNAFFSVDAQFLFDLQLHWKTMGIPTGFS